MQHLPTHPRLRHPLTGEPLRAVGIGRRGPIWPIIGASPDGDPPAGDPPAGDSPKGEPGKDDPPADPPKDWESEFNAQRKINRKLERDSKPFFDALKHHGLSADEAIDLINKGKKPKDGEPPVDADKVRREAEREANARANARIVRSEVRALAAEGFANPLDALHNLNLDDYEVDENGELTDAAKVKADLAEVLRENPHYAKGGRAPRPDPSQGPRGNDRPDPGPGRPRLRSAIEAAAK
jgi:hypothetical protein